jgi:hypothetical protein
VLRIAADGVVDFTERTFLPEGGIAGEVRHQVNMQQRVAENTSA